MIRFFTVSITAFIFSLAPGAVTLAEEAAHTDHLRVITEETDTILLPQANRQPAILHEPSDVPVGDQAALYEGLGDPSWHKKARAKKPSPGL